MSAELRKPLAQSDMSVVLGFLERAKRRPPNRVIAQSIDLDVGKVKAAVSNLRHGGYLARPTRDESVRVMSEAVSLAKGNIWYTVKPYAEMWMSSREIKEAVLLKHDRYIERGKIATVLAKARLRKKLRRLTQEEKSDIAKDSHTLDDIIKNRVDLWLQIAEVFQGSKLRSKPSSRSDWKVVIAYVHNRREQNGQDLSPAAIINEMSMLLREKHERERREKIALAELGRKLPEEQVRRQSAVWERVGPWRARGGTIKEIADVTGFNNKQVENAIYRERLDWYRIDPSLLPDSHVLRRRAQVPDQPRQLVERRTMMLNKQYSIAFAKALDQRDLVGWDFTYLFELRNLYAKYNRRLPESAYDVARLEVLLRAHQEGDVSLLATYREIGAIINDDWSETSLVREEDFVATHVEIASPTSTREDSRGFFWQEGSRKWRPVVAEGTFFDNSLLARERERSRERAQGRKPKPETQ